MKKWVFLNTSFSNGPLSKPLMLSLFAATLFFSGNVAYSAQATLTWDAPDASTPAGYKVYYGVADHAYTNNVDAGKITRCTIKDLEEGKTYYFAATAYYPGGTESGFSNQAVKSIPLSNPDTDEDGIPDREERDVTKTDPKNADTDGDGIPDGDEQNTFHSDPNNKDTDGDGLSDGEEAFTYETDLHSVDSDEDGYLDGEEVHVYHTDPADSDTNGDGIPDGREIRSDIIEAESGYLIDGMRLKSGTSTSKGAYIASTTPNRGAAVYSFIIDEAGIYSLKGMVFATGTGADSFYVDIDRHGPLTWDLNPTADPAAFNAWREVDMTRRENAAFELPVPIALAAGRHLILIRGREAGARLDYFFFEKTGDMPPR